MSDKPVVQTAKYALSIDRFLQERLERVCDSVLHAHASAVDGDIAEFGIGNGSTFQVMAFSLGQIEPRLQGMKCAQKKLYGFDSFQGMPVATLPGDIDAPLVQNNRWGPGTCGSPGRDAIQAMASKWISADRIQLFEGWFKDTMPLLDPSVKFSLVNIDCDFYESTLQVLEFLFGQNRLSDGCTLLFDDFLENRSSKKLGQRKAWRECVEKFAPDFTDAGFYGLAGWRCIIHV